MFVNEKGPRPLFPWVYTLKLPRILGFETWPLQAQEFGA